MYAIAGYLLIVIYGIFILIIALSVLMIFAVIITSINGIIADSKHYRKEEQK